MSGLAPGGLVFYTGEESENLEELFESAFSGRAWIRFGFYSRKGTGGPRSSLGAGRG